MLEIFCERKILGLRACDAHSEALLCDLPQGKRLRVKITQDRSGPHHRLFFAMLSMVAKGCGRDAEELLDIIKIETGHVRKVKANRRTYEFPASIAWHNMDQRKFNAFFEVACQVIEEEVGLKQPALMAELREQFPDIFGVVFREERESA